MTQELPKLDALVTFAAVAKGRSFSGAAKALHVTPSAVSHRIVDLESQLGVPLFVRTTRSVRLTPAGRELWQAVDAGLEQIREAWARVRAGAAVRTLTVSCSPSFAIRWLLPNIGEFRALQPSLVVHVAADDRIADPRRDDIDVCIRYGAGKYPGVEVERLTSEYVFPVCSSQFAQQHRLTRASQLTRLPLLHHDVMKEHPGRVDWPRWFGRAGLQPTAARAGMRFSHAHMALAAALAGEGVALGRTSLVKQDLARGHLVAPVKPRVCSGLSYWLVTERGRSDDVDVFVSWLRSALKGNPGARC